MRKMICNKKKMAASLMAVLLAVMLALPVIPAKVSRAEGVDLSQYNNLMVTDNDNAASLEGKKVKFNGIEWYIIYVDDRPEPDPESPPFITLFAVNPICAMEFGTDSDYDESSVQLYLDSLTGPNGSFASVAAAIDTSNVRCADPTDDNPFWVEGSICLPSWTDVCDLPVDAIKCTTDAEAENSYFWTRYFDGDKVICADGATGNSNCRAMPSQKLNVRPELDLLVDKVDFSNNTFTLKSAAPTPTPTVKPTPTPTVKPTPTPTPASKKQTKTKIKITKATVKKGKKAITGTVSVKGATVKIKVGSKAFKKATVKGKNFTLKLSSKLKKKTKVTINVTKKNCTGVKKTYTVK